MWIFFEDGTFYSSVVNREVVPFGSARMVRTRDRRSAVELARFLVAHRLRMSFDGVLETDPLLNEAVVVSRPPADYGWRVLCTEKEWKTFVDWHIYSQEATNFKSEVQRRTGADGERGRWLRVLHDCWSVLYSYQEHRPSHLQQAVEDLDAEWDTEWDDEFEEAN